MKDNIIWADITGYEGFYKISTEGDVFSIRSNKILKAGFDGKGYYQVNLCVSMKVVASRVHRLVAQAFLEGFSKDSIIDHVNGNRLDNRASNLEIVSVSENNLRKNRLINQKRGAHFDKARSQWIARLGIKFLGRFNTAEEAHERYRSAYVAHYGIEPWN